MEILKSCLKMCCKKCLDRSGRKESDGSTRIILPASRKGSVIGVPQTFTFLAQPPEFVIPSEETMNVMAFHHRRKSSCSGLPMSSFPIQQQNSFESWRGIPETTISIHEEIDENSNNSEPQNPYLVTKSNSTKSMRRLSVTPLPPNHPRRNSMSVFDISTDDVDFDLYDRGDIIPDANSNGRLSFSVRYEKKLQQLIVWIHCARGLWSLDDNIPVFDSFVEVALLPPHRRKSPKTCTATRKSAQNPIFNEHFVFDGVSDETASSVSIKLSVITFDKSSRHKQLGSIIHELNIKESYFPAEAIWADIYPDGIKKTEDKGNILINMNYHPADNKIQVGIVKAAGLDISSGTALDGIYVKVALVRQGKVVHKGKSQLLRPVAENPVFDETFPFSLPLTTMDQSCVLVSVCGKTVSGKRTHIGYVSLGPPFFAAGSGLEQWTKMLSMPYTTIGKWHSMSYWKNEATSKTNQCNMF